MTPTEVSSRHEIFDRFDATTGWTVLGNDTTGLASTATHITGTAALTFNKADGAADTAIAGIQKTISKRALQYVGAKDVLRTTFYVSALTDVSYGFIRLGADSSNYTEWRVADTDLQAGWNTVDIRVGEITSVTGNGWDPLNITYLVVGVGFDAESDTLNGIIFDEVSWYASLKADIDVKTEVTLASSDVAVVSASGANAAHDEDTAHQSGDAGVVALGVSLTAHATPSGLSGTTGDYEPPQISGGAVYTRILRRDGFTADDNSTISSAGTAEQLAGATVVAGFYLFAEPSNTGYMYFGAGDVSSTVYSIKLAPGEASPFLRVDNTNDLFADSDVSGDGFYVAVT